MGAVTHRWNLMPYLVMGELDAVFTYFGASARYVPSLKEIWVWTGSEELCLRLI